MSKNRQVNVDTVKIQRYDVFLSHNSDDKAAVKKLAESLIEKGIKPWLDIWNLVPGQEWQPALEDALDCCDSCAVLIGPSGISPWQNQEMRAAIDLRVKNSGYRVIPVLLPHAEHGQRSLLPKFLAAATWVDFPGSDYEDALDRLIAGIRGIEPGPGYGQSKYRGKCPYRGLEFFDVQHAHFFFGREAIIDSLLNELRLLSVPKGENRFLAIIGPSGSGKSSLARAGLIDAIKNDKLEKSSEWETAICRPGVNPLENLALALSSISKIENTLSNINDLIKNFRDSEFILNRTTRLAFSDSPPGKRLVLLIDQFEEVFTLCSDESIRKSFMDNLLYAANAEDGNTVVIITLRADFVGKCAAYPGLTKSLNKHLELVGPMTDDELRCAIERPAQITGYQLEAGLTERLLDDIKGQPGGLPLLQHALLELWEQRKSGKLTFEAYEDIGRVEGALKRRAEEIFNSFTETEKHACQQVFLRLTQFAENTEDTRRRVSLKELMPAKGEQKLVEKVVQTLTDARLIISESPGEIKKEQFVEVAHEALIRSWPRLREWIDEDRSGLLIHRQLTQASKEWEKNNHDESYLYDGLRLNIAKEWAVSQIDILNVCERNFLFCSLINDNADIKDWIPRYGDVKTTIQFAHEFLTIPGESQRLKGLSILRWLSGVEADKAVNPLLLQIILTDDSQAVSNRAAEVLVERGQIDWLISNLNSPGLLLDQKSRLIKAIGHSRNLPVYGAKLDKALKGRFRRRIIQSAARQLVLNYKSQFAIVISLSFIVGEIGLQIISRISLPLEKFIGRNLGGLPYAVMDVVVMLGFALYMILRQGLDKRPISARKCIWVGFFGALISKFILVIGRIAEKIIGAFIEKSMSGLSYAVIEPLVIYFDNIVAMITVAFFIYGFSLNKSRLSKLLLFSVLGPFAAVSWRMFVNPLVFYLMHGKSLQAFTGDQVISSLYTCGLGIFITFSCLLGFRAGMRIAFNKNPKS